MKQIKKWRKFIAYIPLLLFILMPVVSYGQILSGDALKGMDAQTENFRGQSGFETATEDSVGSVIATVITAFLSLLGIIFVILILVGGYHWMTAGGNEEKVEKAKNTISRAVIGLIIVVSAYAITYFVFSNLGSVGGGGGHIGGSPP